MKENMQYAYTVLSIVIATLQFRSRFPLHPTFSNEILGLQISVVFKLCATAH